jgi:magnesium-transporting ATPase (P-type)
MGVPRSAQAIIAALTGTEGDVVVLRGGDRVRVISRDLVPGDVVIVSSESTLPADFVVLSGSGLVCDESGLTGESMPVRKVPLPRPVATPSGNMLPSGERETYSAAHRDAKHTLFAGCRVLQAGDTGSNDEILALCTATGIETSRGQLVAHILFPEPMRFVYDEEFPIVLGILGVCCLVIFNLAAYMQELSGQPKSGISAFAYGLFTISQTVSPLLPLSLLVGQTASFKRLKAQGVNCIDPKRIAIAVRLHLLHDRYALMCSCWLRHRWLLRAQGKVRVFCFDKTGMAKHSHVFCLCSAMSYGKMAVAQARSRQMAYNSLGSSTMSWTWGLLWLNLRRLSMPLS